MKVRERHISLFFRVLGKVSYDIQGVHGPLDSFQHLQGPLDTLYFQDNLHNVVFDGKSSSP